VAEGDVIVTEIHIQPMFVPDAGAQWFEIVNTSSTQIELEGMVVITWSGNFAVLGSHQLLPGEHFVFGRTSDLGHNGGVPVDYEWRGEFYALDPMEDEIVLASPSGRPIDRVYYVLDGGSPLYSPGYSISLSPAAYDYFQNDFFPGPWCLAVDEYYPGGDHGSPGELNPPCGWE
jgi:hypothetical protein